MSRHRGIGKTDWQALNLNQRLLASHVGDIGFEDPQAMQIAEVVAAVHRFGSQALRGPLARATRFVI